MAETFIDASGMLAIARALEAGPKRVTDAMRMAINDAGDKARTQVVRSLAQQSGVTHAKARQSIRVKRARDDKLDYEITASGEHLSLRSFDAVQRKKGVSARPWGKRRIFRGTFMVRKLNNQVFKRVAQAHFTHRRDKPDAIAESALGLGGGIDALGGIGAGIGGITKRGRGDIVKLWGPALPKELLSDAVTTAFDRVVRERLPVRLAHHMGRLFPDVEWR